MLRHPSAQIRSIPSFTMALPAGWISAEVADGLLLAGTPPELKDRWTTILLQHERAERPYDLEMAATDTWRLEQSLAPEAEILEEQVVATRQRTIYMRAASYPAVGEAEPIGQAQMLFFSPVGTNPTLDLFKLTCLAPESQIKSFMPELFDVAASFRFEDDPSDDSPLPE